jgi:hypothetical protein
MVPFCYSLLPVECVHVFLDGPIPTPHKYEEGGGKREEEKIEVYP